MRHALTSLVETSSWSSKSTRRTSRKESQSTRANAITWPTGGRTRLDTVFLPLTFPTAPLVGRVSSPFGRQIQPRDP